MAWANVTLKNKELKDTKVVPFGVSWTSLFFGWLVPFVRKDVKTGVLSLLLTIAFNLFGLGLLINFFMMFVYNRYYLHKLLKNNYEIVNIEVEDGWMAKLSKKLEEDRFKKEILTKEDIIEWSTNYIKKISI